MDLDRLFQRVFGDAEPEHWGTGWISGTLSVFLGVLGLAAVACLIWPQLLTSPDVRALLPLTWVRASIEVPDFTQSAREKFLVNKQAYDIPETGAIINFDQSVWGAVAGGMPVPDGR